MHLSSMQCIQSQHIQRPITNDQDIQPSNFLWYSEHCETLCHTIAVNTSREPGKILTLYGSGYMIPSHLKTEEAFQKNCYQAEIYSDDVRLRFCVMLRSYDQPNKTPIQLHFWFTHHQPMPSSQPRNFPENIH